jgi:hypothetical protein
MCLMRPIEVMYSDMMLKFCGGGYRLVLLYVEIENLTSSRLVMLLFSRQSPHSTRIQFDKMSLPQSCAVSVRARTL